MNSEEQKRQVGKVAAARVKDGMRIGLGSGTTARAFVRALGERVSSGLEITAVASSTQTAVLAAEVGIEIVKHDSPIDLAVDGADAIARDSLAAIKGLGGALVRERLVAESAAEFLIIADESKLFHRLDDSQPELPVPVEILPFGWELTRARLAALGTPRLRSGDSQAPFVTDNGNYILDMFECDYSSLVNLAGQIKAMTGVVDHGLFLNLASAAIIGTPDGVIELGRAPGAGD
ncbi:MAG: ribose-5-phosphate isomerase RpiA [Thermomicrobiales bacterium]